MSNHAQFVATMWFLVVFAAFVAGFVIYLWADSVRVDRRNLIARADRQHRQCLADDPRGVYGDYPPVGLDGEPAGRWTDPTGYEWVP